MIGAGAISGGIGSVLGGGSFWDGLGQGLITSGLNHAAHALRTSSGAGSPLPDGRYIWELTDEEFGLFANPETRPQVTGCYCDIELTLSERMYLLGKDLTWASPTVKILTLLKADDFIRYSSKTLVSNQLIKGKGAAGAQRIPALKGGGTNPVTGARLPYHFHIHKYNWYKPWSWFKQTPIIKP